ncbi:MAG: shikimate dehydrogenase family protein [Saprospiraceae bacterium]
MESSLLPEIDNRLLQYDKLYGLIGYPLSHSFSKRYFTEKFENEGITDCFYELFPLEKIELLLSTIKSCPNLSGLNVTIPYKESVIGYLNLLDEGARRIGAVNCIKIERGFLLGYNTDAYGFERALLEFLQAHQAQPQQALVLGTGGAAKAVHFVLSKLQLRYTTVSREPGKGDLTYEALTSLEAYPLIINTTPLGMAPNYESYPDIPYHCLSEQHLLYDLVYNPEQTLFLQKGAQQGAATQNGLSMLYYQAEKAWEIWSTPARLPNIFG